MLARSLDLWFKLEHAWCKLMHDSPMWPINGRYQCRRCLRHHPVAWEVKDKAVMSTPTLLAEDTPLFV